MNTYELRTELRELEKISNIEETFVLPKELRKEIEDMSIKLDRAITVSQSYREVLRDILK